MKKKILIILITILILSAIVSVFIYSKNKNLEVNIIDNIEVSVNNKAYNTDYIEVKGYTLVSEKEEIDTSKVGEQTIKIKVKNYFGHEKEYSYKVNIIDKEKPTITYKKELEVEQGTKIDLLSDVKVVDNSNEDIKVTIEGDYNFNKSGTYKLYYIAKDSSNNETKEEFTLKVKAKKVTSSNSTSTNKNNSSSTTNSSNNQTDKTFTTSKGFTGITKNGITYIDGYLIVNKTYSLPSNYGTGLTSTTKSSFNKMQAAAKLDGINIYLASGFRSYTTQKNLYNRYVNRDGKKAADTYSARPGHSEHQSGLAFDVCSHDLDGKNACINSNFNDTNQAKWLSDNCYKYGFILRYPEGKTNETGYKYESWHFRYVGVELATKLYNNGNWITLEDYFGITSEY